MKIKLNHYNLYGLSTALVEMSLKLTRNKNTFSKRIILLIILIPWSVILFSNSSKI